MCNQTTDTSRSINTTSTYLGRYLRYHTVPVRTSSGAAFGRRPSEDEFDLNSSYNIEYQVQKYESVFGK